MIVQYARERGYQGPQKDPHLTLGENYIVLGINFRPNSGMYPHSVTIQSDSDGTPGLWELSFFDVIDPRLPNGWAFFDLGGGYYSLEPEEFFGDFWDCFHDGDESAERVFTQAVEKVRGFHTN